MATDPGAAASGPEIGRAGSAGDTPAAQKLLSAERGAAAGLAPRSVALGPFTFVSLRWKALVLAIAVMLGFAALSVWLSQRALQRQLLDNVGREQLLAAEQVSAAIFRERQRLTDLGALVLSLLREKAGPDAGESAMVAAMDAIWAELGDRQGVDGLAIVDSDLRLTRGWGSVFGLSGEPSALTDNGSAALLLACEGACRAQLLFPLVGADSPPGRHRLLIQGPVLSLVPGSFRSLHLALLELPASMQAPSLHRIAGVAAGDPVLASLSQSWQERGAPHAGDHFALNGRHFDAALLPLPGATWVGPDHLLVASEISARLLSQRLALREQLFLALAALAAIGALLVSLLWQPIERLRRIVAALPLLGQRRYLQARSTLDREPKRPWLYDELDELDATAVDLSLRLEVLQEDVEQRSAALQHERDFIARLLDTARVFIATLDRQGRILRVNDFGLRLSGYGLRDLVGHRLAEHLGAGDRDAFQAGLAPLLAGEGRAFSHECQLLCRDGTQRALAFFHSRLPDWGDGVGSRPVVISAGVDITARQHAEQSLRLEKERVQVTLESIADAVISTDAEGRVSYLNFTAEKLVGWARASALGLPAEQVLRLHGEHDGPPVVHPVRRSLTDPPGERRSEEWILHSQDDARYVVAISAAPIHGPAGEVGGAVVVFRDVSKERHLARQLTYQATHDSLTGLVNRSELEKRVAAALEHAQVEDTEHALLFLDLDQFKIVNDSCGHHAGDRLLCQLAHLLRSPVRVGDTVARLGGDEFGVLLTHCHLERGISIAELIRQTVEEHRFVWSSRSFNVGVSVGLVAITRESESVEQLFQAADSACYLSKEAGRNRVSVHRAEHEGQGRRSGEMQWASRITRALEAQRFTLYAQRIQSISASGGADHHEILVRMLAEDGSQVMPGAFIPAAERYNLMPLVDRWVVDKLMTHLAERGWRGDGEGVIAVNLSGQSLGQGAFLEFLRGRFDRFGLYPGGFCFEITETAAIANLNRASEFMRACREVGCQFALDDFGSGLSSFGYLKTLPVDYLKIDGMFVKDILRDPIDMAMVRSINQIGKVMGLKTIAECVESEAIITRLAEEDVDYVQGFAIAEPRPLAELMI